MCHVAFLHDLLLLQDRVNSIEIYVKECKCDIVSQMCQSYNVSIVSAFTAIKSNRRSASSDCSSMACRQFFRRASCGRFCSGFCLLVKRNLLLVLLIVGAVIGFAIGALTNDPVTRITDPEKKATVLMLIAFPGELFMNMLKMIVLPLIVATLITAVSTVNPDVTGRIGRRTVIYYLSTLVLAAILGLTLVLTIRPGLSGDHGAQKQVESVKYRKLDSLLDMLR